MPEPEVLDIIGQSAAMKRVARIIERIAPTSASILITGESGTGKDLVARLIHARSPRHDNPYIAVNCAAIPEALMESELFGHERGAFTGADRRRLGRFEIANGGTLFLDEIAEMKPELQTKLLRVIENQVIERLGGSPSISLDVRIIAATNRDPKSAIREGQLRSDLYYRLKILSVELPPLRERPEDIPLLAEHFVKLASKTEGRNIVGADPECLKLLMAYHWPGNIRELRHVIAGAVIMSDGPLLSPLDLPDELRPASDERPYMTARFGISLAELEEQFVIGTLSYLRNNKAQTARVLGLSRRALLYRLERYRKPGAISGK